MKILVLGGSGLLGRDLCKLLESEHINYLATYNNNYIKNGIKLNFNNFSSITNLIEKYAPTICINCIVERQVDKCESDWNLVKKTNIDIPNIISTICNKFSIHLIHISTDYVFDGYKSPYLPTNETNPLQNYGISKLIAEKRIIANCQKYTIIRVPVLYTDNINNFEENAVSLIGKKILNQIESSKEDNHSIRRPVFIPDLCIFIYYLINNPANGILHFYNPLDKITKYEMLQLIANYLNKSHTHITANNTPDLTRPYDTQLIDNQYDITKYQITRINKGIELCFQKIYHPPLLLSTRNTQNIFILLDLDGTITNTDYIHFQCYKTILAKHDIDFTYSEFEEAINIGNIDNLIKTKYTISEKIFENIKRDKQKLFTTFHNIQLIPGAEQLLNYIHDNNINHAIATNTNRICVEHMKSQLPILNKLKNWITREDYTNPKPSSECYDFAIKNFYNNEQYIIGFENTINGFNALKSITKCVYIITDINNYNYNIFKKEDVYLIKDYCNFLTQ